MANLIDLTTGGQKHRHPEKRNRPDTEVLRKPEWIRVKAPVSKGYAETRQIVKSKGLVTVCEEAGCPNIGECWDKKHATMMILGEVCTRACSVQMHEHQCARMMRVKMALPSASMA